MENFGKFCFWNVALIITIMVGGAAFMKIWEWLIVPVFGLKELRLVEAVAVSFFIAYIKMNATKEADKTFSQQVEQFIHALTLTAIMVGMAYIIHLFL